MVLHMDGARFANAVASLNCVPRTITWEVGVDVLCFGGTKNGIAAGELVIFFNKEISREFDYRVKQAGQLGSKMRFLASAWVGLLAEEAWLRNARHANRMANRLAQSLQSKGNLEVICPVEANSVFVRMNHQLVQGLQARGWRFYKFVEPDVYRLMCSWATNESDIADFIRDITQNH
jgi:threonine aldolase